MEKLKFIVGYLPFGLTGALGCDCEEDFSELIELVEDESKFKKNAIWKYSGFADSDLCVPLGEGEIDGVLMSHGNTYACFSGVCKVKPILRPLSDLTNDIYDFIYNKECDYPSIEDWINLDTESRFSCKFSYEFWQLLYMHKFDIHGLIEKGEAIDVNTLKS